MKIQPLTWASFAFMALAIVVGGFAPVVPSLIGPYFEKAAVVATALAALCLHPPWAPAAAAPTITLPAPAKVSVEAPAPEPH